MPPQQNFLKLSAVQERNLLEQVMRHRDEALEARADFPLRHAERYRRYLADPTLRPPGPWPEAVRLFVPTTRSVLERLHAEVWQALFANPRQVQAVPFGDEDAPAAELITRFMAWALASTVDWPRLTSSLLLDALLDSVGVCKVMAWEPPWPAPSSDVRRFLRRQVRMDALDLGMLLVAPDAEGLQYPECRFVAQEFFLTSDDLLRMRARGFDTPAYDQLGDSQVLTDRKRVELEREGERVVEFRPESIPFLESYERFAMEDDGLDEDVIVSVFPDAQIQGTSHNTSENHGRIAGVRRLRDVFPQDDRPRRPFFAVTFWSQSRQWRGLNVPDRLESMQDLINRLHEQLVNYGDVAMLPFVFVNTFLTGELPDLRTVRPGATVPIDDVSGVQFAPTRSLNRHFAEQIALMQANVERDTQVTDFNLGRQGQSSTAPRTAAATLALLGESRKSYGMLVRGAAHQFGQLLSFSFRLWQDILPDDTYVNVGEPTSGVEAAEPSSQVWDRLFARQEAAASRSTPPRLVALPISREALSGFYDIRIEVNPEEQFDRQVVLSLTQLTAPAIQDYPLGMRLMLKRLWTLFDQRGFEEIYPEEVALLQTQVRFMAIQAQLAAFEQQLRQVQQAEAQQQLQRLQAGAQQYQDTGQLDPAFVHAVRTMVTQNGAQTGEE